MAMPFDVTEAIAKAVSQLATKADLATLKADLDSKLALLEQRMTIKFGGMMLVAVGIILTGFKLIH